MEIKRNNIKMEFLFIFKKEKTILVKEDIAEFV